MGGRGIPHRASFFFWLVEHTLPPHIREEKGETDPLRKTVSVTQDRDETGTHQGAPSICLTHGMQRIRQLDGRIPEVYGRILGGRRPYTGDYTAVFWGLYGRIVPSIWDAKAKAPEFPDCLTLQVFHHGSSVKHHSTAAAPPWRRAMIGTTIKNDPWPAKHCLGHDGTTTEEMKWELLSLPWGTTP